MAAALATPGGRRLLLWGATLVLALAAVAWQLAAPPRDGPAPDDEAALERLFPQGLGEIAALEILVGGTLHRFERDAAGAWYLHAHAHGSEGQHSHAANPDSAARIAAALTMLGEARIERRIAAAPAERGTYGLVFPSVIVLAYRRETPRPVLSLHAGAVAPDGLSRYALLVERDAVLTLANYQIVNLVELTKALGETP